MCPELPHRPSSGALSIHSRFSFLCLSPKPFLALHPKLLEQVRRPGQDSHSPQGWQPAKMQPQPLCLGSQGKGFKLSPSDISHESALHPGTGTRVPPDTLGLFWVAEAGPRASGQCLEFRGCETGVFPSPWGGQSSEGLLQPLLFGLWTEPHQSQGAGPGEAGGQRRSQLTAVTVTGPERTEKSCGRWRGGGQE